MAKATRFSFKQWQLKSIRTNSLRQLTHDFYEPGVSDYHCSSSSKKCVDLIKTANIINYLFCCTLTIAPHPLLKEGIHDLLGISNGNRTEWSPIRSVIIRVITKSDDRAAGVRFVHHEYDYRPNWTTRSLITNTKVWKGKIYIKSFYTVCIVIETKVVIGWFKLQLWMWLAYWTVR